MNELYAHVASASRRIAWIFELLLLKPMLITRYLNNPVKLLNLDYLLFEVIHPIHIRRKYKQRSAAHEMGTQMNLNDLTSLVAV